VAAIRVRLVEHYGSPASVNKGLAALRGLLREAFNLGRMGADDLARCRSVKSVRGSLLPKGRALTDDEVSRLFAACPANAPIGARDGAATTQKYDRRAERAKLAVARLMRLPRSE
jgi:integrase